MTTTINAVSGTGLTQTSDGSGIVKLQSNGVATNALVWVNFGYISSAITIRSSYNVSSVTRNGTGDYTINFTNALPDTNYGFSGYTSSPGSASSSFLLNGTYTAKLTTTIGLQVGYAYSSGYALYNFAEQGLVFYG